jgi:hypothetical protein
MRFSAADLTILRIRCPACGQHTEKLVTVLVKKTKVPCSVCGALIDLDTPINNILIKETAESCERIGALILKKIAEQVDSFGSDRIRKPRFPGPKS